MFNRSDQRIQLRSRHWQKPRLVGLAFEFQQVTRLPTQRWMCR